MEYINPEYIENGNIVSKDYENVRANSSEEMESFYLYKLKKMKEFRVESEEEVRVFYSCTVKANSKEEAIEKADLEWDWQKDDEELVQRLNIQAEEV